MKRHMMLSLLAALLHVRRLKQCRMKMDSLVVWLIIAAFYAPLHYLLPVLVLFITGKESEDVRSGLIRRALIDSTLSMVGAFAIVIYLAESGMMSAAMLILLLSMLFPFIGIWRHRREIADASE